MRTRLCLCSLSLILVCGAAYAEPEEELISPSPQAAAPEADAEALARLQKMRTSGSMFAISKAAFARLSTCNELAALSAAATKFARARTFANAAPRPCDSANEST